MELQLNNPCISIHSQLMGRRTPSQLQRNSSHVEPVEQINENNSLRNFFADISAGTAIATVQCQRQHVAIYKKKSQVICDATATAAHKQHVSSFSVGMFLKWPLNQDKDIRTS